MKRLLPSLLVAATLLTGCQLPTGDYVAASAISQDGFARDGAALRQLQGQEVKIWGFVDHGNLYGDEGTKLILGDWWSGEGPDTDTWRFNLKANADDEVGHSFPVHVPNDPGRDALLKAFAADARTGQPTQVYVKGRIFTFDAPANVMTLSGLLMELEGSQDIQLERPKQGDPMPAKAAAPAYVTDLEAAYGAPSQAGFGSAVFYEQIDAAGDLEQMALDKYQYFVGDLWARYGEAAWMGPWHEVYARPPGAEPDIVAELRGIEDADAANSAPMILDVVEDAARARAALAAAFDDPAVTELRVFNLGDGGAMSGILVAGRRGATGEATFLLFLLD